MPVTQQDIEQALLTLSPSDQAALSSSNSGNASPLTKFACSLAVEVVRAMPGFSQDLQMSATFKGSATGASKGTSPSTPGLQHLRQHLLTVASQAGMLPPLLEERMLDLLVWRIHPSGLSLRTEVTVESEAIPITPSQDLWDFDKLLMVHSPHRIFVGRVNMIKQAYKLADVRQRMNNHAREAMAAGSFQVAHNLNVVMVETVAKPRPQPVVHLWRWDHVKSCLL